MYRTHICQKVDLEHKEKQALIHLRLKFRGLLETRYLADYGDTRSINLSRAKLYWRDANRLVKLLNSLVERGLL